MLQGWLGVTLCFMGGMLTIHKSTFFVKFSRGVLTICKSGLSLTFRGASGPSKEACCSSSPLGAS